MRPSVLRWCCAAFLCLGISSPLAAPGPGIQQATFLPPEIGKEIFHLPASMVGGQPTMIDFQHGYLYVGSAHSLDNTITSKAIWINLSNPRSPTVITQINTGGNKPHMAAFYRDRMLDGFQSGNNFRIWDFDDKFVANTYSGSVNPVWYMCQFPYVFRPFNGYGTGTNLMEIADIRNGNGTRVKLLDLGAVLGFAVSSTHAIGNVLVCSASQAKGLATFDISNPANPILLDQIVTGNPVYTSMVHGSRVYQCESGAGIRVYDFSDPANLQLVGFIDLPDSPRYVMLKDGKGYCCPGAAKLIVFNAATLAIEQNYALPGSADFAQLIGNMAITGGNEGASRCSIIPIRQAPDTNGPLAQFISPASNAVGQALSSRVGLVMSDQIDVTSLNTNTFIVRPVGGPAVAGTYSTQMGMINFAPNQPLTSDTTYEVILPAGGIRDVVGNGLAQGFTSRFATGGNLSTNQLLARWPFDQSTEDVSGNGHLATLVNGAGFSTNYAEGLAAVALDGTNDYVNGGVIPLGNQFTLAMWAYVPSGVTNIQTLAANSAGGFNANGFRFFINTYQTSNRRLLVESGNGTAGTAFSSPVDTFAFDQWNHVAFVADRAAGTGELFYRGTLVASGNMLTDFSINSMLTIGAFNNTGFPLKGRLDDVRVYARALAAEEIAALAATPNQPPVISSVTASSLTPLVNQNVSFTNHATDPNLPDRLTYSFSFGDGTAATPFSTNRTAQHAFGSAGRFHVVARVNDGSVTVTKTLLIIVHHPISGPSATASSALIFDGSRGKVWSANPDSDTVSRIHATSLAKELEVAVGTKPRSLALKPDGSALWVVCEDSDELWVLDPVGGGLITKTNLGYGVAPLAIAFAPNGSAALIAAKGSEALLRLNPASLAVTGQVGLGAGASSVAFRGDSTRVLVTRFISPENAGQVWEINATTMSLVRTFELAFDNGPDGENSGRGLPNYLMQVAITPDGRRAWIPCKKDNVARGTFRDGQSLNHQNTVRSMIAQLDLLTNVEIAGNRLDVDNHSLPGAVCFSPLGDLAYVAYQANDEVRVFDTASGNSLASFPTGPAPQNLCLSPDGLRLYVLNFLGRSVAMFDVSQVAAGFSSAVLAVGQTNVVGVEKLPANVLAGKKIFYNASDPRMANEGYLTCISCHLDGDTDGRVWDFTDRGEGLRNTTSLHGRRGTGHGRVHWSANFDEIQDFEHDIRGAFGGSGLMNDADFNVGTRNTPLGDTKAGLSASLDALAAYVASLDQYPRSAARQTNGSPTPAAQNGRQHFGNLQCFACHAGPDFTDSNSGLLHDVGTIKPGSGQRLGGVLTGLDTPTLRGLAFTAPYLHDGAAADLPAVFNATNAPVGSAHASVRALSQAQQQELLAFLIELDGSEPAAPPPAPRLELSRAGGLAILSWPNTFTGYALYSNVELDNPAGWTLVTNTVQSSNGYYSVTLPTVEETRFFRLQHP